MSRCRALCFTFVIAVVVLSVALPAFGQYTRNTNTAQVQRRDPGGLKQGTFPMAQTTGDARLRGGVASSNYVAPNTDYRTREWTGSGGGQYDGRLDYDQHTAASGLHQTPTDRRYAGQTEGAWTTG